MRSEQARRIVNLLALVLGTALVWSASAELPWPARLATTVLLAVLPVALLSQARFADELPPGITRRGLYLSTILGIAVMALGAVAAALASGFGRYRLGLTVPDVPVLLAATVLTIAAGLGVVAAMRSLAPEGRLSAFLVPRTAGERGLYVVLCLAAGLGEELVFRSFLIPAVAAACGNVWVAAGLSAGAFGLIHSYQGAVGAVRAALLGFVLAVPFVALGSVLPSMVAHTALDLAAGLWLSRWMLRG